MSISIVAPASSTPRSRSGHSWLDTALSFALIVVFPAVFWLGVAELVAVIFEFSYGNWGRTIAAVVLMSFLTMIWAAIRTTSSK